MKYIMKKRGMILLCVAVFVVLCALFFVLFSSQASADDGDFNQIQGYEQILVRPGDTLDSLSREYSCKYSHLTPTEYKQQIIHLNNLSSEYIRAGVYLLMPGCKSQ